jgi:hypothetical protein
MEDIDAYQDAQQQQQQQQQQTQNQPTPPETYLSCRAEALNTLGKDSDGGCLVSRIEHPPLSLIYPIQRTCTTGLF